MILYSEGATATQEAEAEQILEALTLAYPNHPWAVRVYDGGFFIRHLEFPANWGMNCKTKTSYSASSLKREVIRMAGEWLERAGLPRRVWDETPITHVEGVPQRFQPDAEPTVHFEKCIYKPESALRTEPRPQAVIEAEADD